jgi:hypothetical protein
MQPKYPKGLLWKMNLTELEAIADAEKIDYPEGIKRLDLFRIIKANMPMVSVPIAPASLVVPPAPPPPVVEELDDSPASARIKRIRQAN